MNDRAISQAFSSPLETGRTLTISPYSSSHTGGVPGTRKSVFRISPTWYSFSLRRVMPVPLISSAFPFSVFSSLSSPSETISRIRSSFSSIRNSKPDKYGSQVLQKEASVKDENGLSFVRGIPGLFRSFEAFVLLYSAGDMTENLTTAEIDALTCSLFSLTSKPGIFSVPWGSSPPSS